MLPRAMRFRVGTEGAVATNIWEGHLIYWIGPIIGAVIGAQLYKWVLMRHSVAPAEHGPVEPI